MHADATSTGDEVDSGLEQRQSRTRATMLLWQWAFYVFVPLFRLTHPLACCTNFTYSGANVGNLKDFLQISSTMRMTSPTAIGFIISTGVGWLAVLSLGRTFIACSVSNWLERRFYYAHHPSALELLRPELLVAWKGIRSHGRTAISTYLNPRMRFWEKCYMN